MALVRSRGTQNALELHTGDHIGVPTVAITLIYMGIKGFKARRENDGPHLQLMDLPLLL